MTTVQDLQKQFHCCMPLFIALGDKVRLSIVELLTEAAVRSRPAISHHLKILKDAGLVGVRQDGTANYYYLTLRDSTRSLMELGYRLEEFM